MNIVVLAGGLSPERDVSLSSGCLISKALMTMGHRLVLIDVYEGLKSINSSYDDLFHSKPEGNTFDYLVPETEPDLKEVISRNNFQKSKIGANVIELCKYADVVFISLHGDMGENGMLQATLDNYNIKYTGSGYMGCALAMDKDISKKLFRYSGIPTPDWITCDIRNTSFDCSEITEKIGFPCVMKPCSCGSSIGVSIVTNDTDLRLSVEKARVYESRIIVEKHIEGREFSVGILDGNALPVIEIIPHTGFYDYKAKYQPGLTNEICPAQIPDDEAIQLQQLAEKVHVLLRLGGYSRVDFMVHSSGAIFCLEVNALPGMTPTSLLPQEAQAAGIDYPHLCERIAVLPFTAESV